jgi:hypothetical protein
MKNVSKKFESTMKAVSCVGAAVAVAALVAGAALVVAPRDAAAKPEFASQTGLPCGKCHVNPAGGGKNTAFGDKFKANGYKVK